MATLTDRYCNGCHATRRFLVTAQSEQIREEVCGVCGRQITVAKHPANETREQRIAREVKGEFLVSARRY